MTNYKDYFIYFMLGGLFLLGIMSFGMQMASNSQQSTSIMTSEFIDFTSTQGNLSEVENKINFD